MYKFVVWSYSNHFQNKVLPSIKNNKKIKIKYILTKKNKKNIFYKNIRLLKKREQLKSLKNINYIYISSVNVNHYKDIKYSLLNKFNVICEKPICLKSSQLKILSKISKKKKVKFFEMIQYKHHPVFLKLKEILKKNIIGKIKNVKSEFKIPLKDKKNIRFKKELGGGAINDVGFYPISIMFTLFESKEIKILKKKILKENKLDIKGSLNAKNENEILFKLAWGFKSPYKNFIKIKGTRGEIETKFIFSKKVIQGSEIIIKNSRRKIIKIKKANQINLAFNDILKSKIIKFEKATELSSKILNVTESLIKK